MRLGIFVNSKREHFPRTENRKHHLYLPLNMLQVFWLLLLPSVVMGFVLDSALEKASALSMAPRFDKNSNKWVPSSADEGPEAGYGVLGSLLRQGPQPAFNRIFKADDYEQAVLKFMAVDKVDRNTAQAEMDAYLRNPNDWAYNRVKGYNADYLTLNKKNIILTLVWSVVVLSVVGRGVYCLETGENYWTIFGLTSKVAECQLDNSCLMK